MWQIPRYTVNSVFMTGFCDQAYVRVFRIVLLVGMGTETRYLIGLGAKL